MNKLLPFFLVALCAVLIALPAAPKNKTSAPPLASLLATESLLKTTVILTHAQITGLPGAPVELIPAPGLGKFILPLTATIVTSTIGGYDVSEFAYGWIGNAAENYVPLSYLSENSQGGILGVVLGQGNRLTVVPTGSATYSGNPQLRPMHFQTANAENQAILLNAWTPDGYFAGGDSGNTLKVTVWYVEVDL